MDNPDPTPSPGDDRRVRYELPDPDWYFDHVLVNARPGGPTPQTRRPAAQWQDWWRARTGADRLVQVASEQGFVLATRDLHRFGVTRSRARTLVRRGTWQSPAAGVIAPVDTADESRWVVARRDAALRAGAAALRRPGREVCGRSAAILHGLPTVEVPAEPELANPAGAGLGSGGGVHQFGAALSRAELSSWFRVAVTDVARTVVDVARHSRRDGLVAADAALYEQLTDRAALQRAVERATGWPGVRTAREVVSLADPLAESPLESLVRLALHDDGFPPPTLQHRFGPHRVDFYWPSRRLVLEADGRLKYRGDAGWNEKKRETALRRHDLRVERVLWSDLDQGWPAFSAWFRTCF